MPNTKPLVTAALVCEEVIVGDDGVVSLIRLVDRFIGSLPPNLPANTQAAVQITAFFSVKAGDLHGDHEFRIAMRTPNGGSEPISDPWKVHFDGGDTGGNLKMRIGFPVVFGLYWLELIWNSEVIASTPFTLQQESPTVQKK